MEEICEIRIVSIENMPQSVQEAIIKEVNGKPREFKENFKGFAKVIYVTASPPKIKSVEPIVGTVMDYFKSQGIDCQSFAVF